MAATVSYFWHRYAHHPRWHLDRGCPAIAEAGDDRIDRGRVSRPRALARHQGGRPCRRCTLVPALDDLLSAPIGSRPTRCTIAAHGVDVTDVWDEPSESALDRLARLAERYGWATTSSAAGPLAYTVVPRPVARVLSANLRCLWDDTPGVLDAATVAAVWSLAGQFHGAAAGTVQDRELWRLAAALVA